MQNITPSLEGYRTFAKLVFAKAESISQDDDFMMAWQELLLSCHRNFRLAAEGDVYDQIGLDADVLVLLCKYKQIEMSRELICHAVEQLGNFEVHEALQYFETFRTWYVRAAYDEGVFKDEDKLRAQIDTQIKNAEQSLRSDDSSCTIC